MAVSNVPNYRVEFHLVHPNLQQVVKIGAPIAIDAAKQFLSSRDINKTITSLENTPLTLQEMISVDNAKHSGSRSEKKELIDTFKTKYGYDVSVAVAQFFGDLSLIFRDLNEQGGNQLDNLEHSILPPAGGQQYEIIELNGNIFIVSNFDFGLAQAKREIEKLKRENELLQTNLGEIAKDRDSFKKKFHKFQQLCEQPQ